MRLRLILRMLGFIRLVWPTALVAASIVITRIVFEVTSVYFISPAISSLSMGIKGDASGGFFHWLLDGNSKAQELRRLLLWMGLAQLGLGTATYLRTVWDTKLSMRIVYHLRSAIYDRLQSVHFSFHDRLTTGQLINRALSDLQAVRNFVNVSFIWSLDIFGSVGAYLILLGFRSTWLMLAALLPIPVWLWMIRHFSKKAQPAYRLQQEASDHLMVALTQNVSGVHVVKAFGIEAQEIEKYSTLNSKLLSRMLFLINLQSKLTPSMKGVAGLTHILLFTLAVSLIKEGSLEVGDLMILGFAMGTILTKLQNINIVAETYQKAVVSSQRIFEILDTPQSTLSGKVMDPFRIDQGTIEFEDVSLYFEESAAALKGITVSIPGGKTTAIIGPTGAGKTALVSLIARFYDPQVGVVKIDGQDLSSVNLTDLRRAVGYVFQETFLFTDTIINNIRYGRQDVNDEMLYAAARAAQIDEFISTLPMGYETLLGECGVQLSGGQRQRLALARALVYDPKILILDDATAALDAKTEYNIQNNLNSLIAGRTTIVIAHRMTTLQAADYVLVMENGTITQGGTHLELLSRDGHYREILKIHLSMYKVQPKVLEAGTVE